MNVKFGRNYIMTIQSSRFSPPIVIGLPFTIDFTVTRNSYSSSNDARITLYNLSEYHRNLLRQDQWDKSVSATLNITLQAGYGSGPQYPIIFQGNTTRAYSVRQGVNYLTILDAFDGGKAYQNAISNLQFTAGQSIASVYSALINDLLPYGISKGAVSTYLGNLAKGVSFSGNTMDILRDLTNSNFFVDNLKANILQQGDAIGGNTVTINAASGLLGTPIKENQWLSFDIIFEPRIVIGTVINIDSLTAVNTYNGIHKVVSVQHRGTISAAVAGNCITSLGVEAGIFQEVLQNAGL